jgi:hypothetical protein
MVFPPFDHFREFMDNGFKISGRQMRKTFGDPQWKLGDVHSHHSNLLGPEFVYGTGIEHFAVVCDLIRFHFPQSLLKLISRPAGLTGRVSGFTEPSMTSPEFTPASCRAMLTAGFGGVGNIDGIGSDARGAITASSSRKCLMLCRAAVA